MIGHAGTAIAGLLAGAALAWAYLKTLWLCVKQLPGSKRPALWMAGTLIVRLAAAVAVFLALGRLGGWQALVGGLVGFMVARGLLVGRIELRPESEARG